MALRKFLHDPGYIQGKLDSGCWKVSSAVFIIPSPSAAAAESDRKRKREENNSTQNFADPFLRNGFFQDPVLIRNNPDNARLLVASYGHWNKSPKSAVEVGRISLSVALPKPSAKDLEILQAVKSHCESNQTNNNLAAIMAGATDNTTDAQIQTLKSTITSLVQQGVHFGFKCSPCCVRKEQTQNCTGGFSFGAQQSCLSQR